MSKAGGEPLLYEVRFSRERLWPAHAAGKIKWEVQIADARPYGENSSIYFDAHGVFQEKVVQSKPYSRRKSDT
jgi:hypothetical protein